jgi:Siphovirus ReqiPepy6 Gp37-like protein
MDLFTLNRKFLKQDVIDGFNSVIWTERYYGDSEVELVVPASAEFIKKLPAGVFLGTDKSKEVMILESAVIDEQEKNLKLTGMSLLPWLNNRFFRLSANPADERSVIGPETPGWAVWAILYWMCCAGSPYLTGATPIGITNPGQLVIPGLGLKDYDKSGVKITYTVEYGPVYDAMRSIAEAYQIGMTITLESATETSYLLGFRSYKGLDHTSSQTANPVVRFSPQMDSLTNITELQSVAALKTLVYVFGTGDPKGDSDVSLSTVPGKANLTGTQYTGFDLRALLVLLSVNRDDVDKDETQTNTVNAAKILELLNARAAVELKARDFVKAVDGEIVPTSQFKYGVHYNLGDIIEVQGNSDIVSKARITEYIHAQDENGERAYPTVAMLE